MKTPSHNQLQLVNSVVRKARELELSKKDFLHWAAICWDAHEDAAKMDGASSSAASS